MPRKSVLPHIVSRLGIVWHRFRLEDTIKIYAFEHCLAVCQVGSWAHSATGNREWCSSCDAGERETPPATQLCVASWHEHTFPASVHPGIPFAKPTRGALPRLGTSSRT